MTRLGRRGGGILCLLALSLGSSSVAPAQVGTAFTYQGRLSTGGSAANGSYDLELKLWDALTLGGQVGTTVTLTNVSVSAGLFTVRPDFGATAFSGSRRFLEIGLRPSGGPPLDPYTTVSPRQELSPSPNALYAVKAGDAATLGGVSAGSYFQIASVVPIGSGGTGAATAPGARANLGVAASGANSDITSLSGLTTPLSLGQGGTGATTAGASLTSLGAQALVTGTCPADSSIQSVNADGTVVCLASDRRPGLSLSILDFDLAGGVGEYTSLTIGGDGLGLISYYSFANADLKVAHCTNAACSTATLATLDSTGLVGKYTSITIGADGRGLISYLDSTNSDLKVAHCSNTACTSATTATLDSVGSVGQYTSITIGADGLGLISYFDSTNFDLKVAHCSNTACTSATTAALESTGFVGQYTSITIGADGLGLISYLDVGNGDLKVAHCSNAACTSATTATLDSAGNVGQYTSITIGADGRGLISYLDSTNVDLKVAYCMDTGCTSATTATLDSTGTVGQYTSITIGANGLGQISYYSYDVGNEALNVAHCSNPACTSATMVTLDQTANVGQHTSITIGADGLALISYYDATSGLLKAAHCSNLLCSPFVVRRR